MADFSSGFYAPARRLFAVWDAMPPPKLRSALSPLDFGARLLPHLSLGQVEEQGADLRYDLVGEVLEEVAPRLKRGGRASDPMRVHPDNHQIYDLLTGCARRQSPLAFQAWFDTLDDVPQAVFSLLLPLGLDASAPACADLLIGVWRLPEAAARRRRGPGRDEVVEVSAGFLAAAGSDPRRPPP
jgi:hypothetical protein